MLFVAVVVADMFGDSIFVLLNSDVRIRECSVLLCVLMLAVGRVYHIHILIPVHNYCQY